MKRLNRPAPIRTETLECCQTTCPECGGPTWLQYRNRRYVVTLDGVVQLLLRVRRCQNPDCPHYHKPYRPEDEGRFVPKPPRHAVLAGWRTDDRGDFGDAGSQ